MKNDKDFIIRVIEYGRKHPEGFNHDNIIENKNLNLLDHEKTIIKKFFEHAYTIARQNDYYDIEVTSINPNLDTIFICLESPRIIANNIGKGGQNYSYEEPELKYIINLDAAFHYIDYLELTEARKTAQQAQENSITSIGRSTLAIIISIIIGIISIGLSLYQINNPITIQPEQLSQLTGSILSISKTLDNIAITQDKLLNADNLIINKLNIQTLTGSITDEIGQHMIGFYPEYPWTEYMYTPDRYQIVIYSKQEITCKSDIKLYGHYDEVTGLDKSPERNEFIEPTFLVDEFECLD